jgi:hypothetical protein
VGVGPVGTQAVVVVVVPEGPAPTGRRREGLVPADPELAAQVRAAAEADVAAVLVTGALPLDIRHASKVDRREVARRAAHTLSGSRSTRRRRAR